MQEMLDQSQIFVSRDPVPRRPLILLSVLGHLLALAGAIVLARLPGPRVLPQHFETSRKILGAVYLARNSIKTTPGQSPSIFTPLRPRAQQPHPMQAQQPGEDDATQTLHERATRATAAMMSNFKFRHTYGFNPGPDYELAFQTAGQIPPIPPTDLPPRFEQYVIVEVTIAADGRVAEARIVAGDVDTTIQQKLLAAIREFKYNPATRDGTAIPSQVDVVIHIPT